jgi:biotin carboxylase
MTDQRPLLIVVGTGQRHFREYLLASIGARYRVHLMLEAEPTWEREHAAKWTVVESTLDADALVAAAGAVAAGAVAAADRVGGVLCWDEARILPTASVAAALGLPGGDPDAVLRCRDKHLTRQALSAAGVPQPRSVLVTSADDALAAAERIGFPVVLKPRALAASLGVVSVDTPAELLARFAFARDTTVPEAPHYDDVVLVEELVQGTEISVDSAVHRGTVTPLFVARKEVGYPPYFEEVGHVVDGADALLADAAIRRLLADTHAALGLADGMTHTEIMLTAAGPKIIEVNARLGGDMIPYLGMRATGIDPGLAAAAVACGRAPDTTADRALVGAVRFCYPERDGTVIGSIRVDEAALPPAVDRVVRLRAAGDVVSPPPAGTVSGRFAYATAVASTGAECRAALDGAEAALTLQPLTLQPLAQQPLTARAGAA